jgi:hypothetical protein
MQRRASSCWHTLAGHSSWRLLPGDMTSQLRCAASLGRKLGRKLLLLESVKASAAPSHSVNPDAAHRLGPDPDASRPVARRRRCQSRPGLAVGRVLSACAQHRQRAPAMTPPQRDGASGFRAALAGPGHLGRAQAAMGCSTWISRRGGTARPSGKSSPVSSKMMTPLHSRLHPCSGWKAMV